MATFLKLSRAAQRAQKSTSTIRRLVKSIVTNNDHPDRSHIKPSPQEVARHEKEDVQFSWEISDELIDRTFPKDVEQGSAPRGDSASHIPAGRLIDTLQQAIQKLEQQLDRKDDQLSTRAQEVERLQNSLQHAQLLQSQLAQKAGLPAPIAATPIEGEQGTIAPQTTAVSIWKTPVDELVRRIFRR